MNLEKQITFFCKGQIERQTVQPVANVALDRGYDVSFASDLTENAEIGYYVSHVYKHRPINSELSIIGFHGLDQVEKGRSHWLKEPWGRYDIGFVPGEYAGASWQTFSWHQMTRPKHGVYPVGWPKSDYLFSDEFANEVDRFKTEYDISQEGKTILYAPATENHDKMSEFVESAIDVADQLLIKNYPREKKTHLIKNQEYMHEKHKNNDDITIIRPSENIMTALHMSDVLVSDESSVLIDALITETIPMSVSDWPIQFYEDDISYPDNQVPHFVHKTNREDLTEDLVDILKHYEQYSKSITDIREIWFNNLGSSAEMSMDIIDSIISNQTPPISSLTPKTAIHLYYYHVFIREGLIESIPEPIESKLVECNIDNYLHQIEKLFRYRHD